MPIVHSQSQHPRLTPSGGSWLKKLRGNLPRICRSVARWGLLGACAGPFLENAWLSVAAALSMSVGYGILGGLVGLAVGSISLVFPRVWLRRARGVFRSAVTWAIAWACFGTVFGSVIVGGSWFGEAVVGATAYAVFGLLTGGIFAALLSLSAGRRGLDEMSQAHFVVLGAAAGFLLPPGLDFMISSGFTFPSLYSAGIMMLLGASSAAASLALARGEKDCESLEANGEAPALLMRG